MNGNGGGNGMVQVAYLHPEDVSHSWAYSMRAMRDYDLARAAADGADLARAVEDGYRIARKPLNLRCGAGMVAHTRNYGVRLFLDWTPHEWLLFIDTDMGFAPDAAHQLLAVADPATRPVVGALCFAMMEAAHDGMGGFTRTIVPTMYKLGTAEETGQGSFCYYGDYPVDEVVPVAGTGGAFLLIHRGALEKLRVEYADHWFDMMYDQVGDIVGEDIAFCGRLLKAGIIPAVHTGVKTTHHKSVWVSEMDYVAQQSVTVQIPDDLPPFIDLHASFAALARYEHDRDGMLKFRQDLDRYAAIIEATRPEVVVETGTRTGGSARWFADRGVDVVTVDVREVLIGREYEGRITQVVGDSVDPDVAARVAELVAGRRCMVSLDSDHSGPHVTAEIGLYGPLVTPGCYLVVEDGIFGYGTSARVQQGLEHMVGSPLDAIVSELKDNPAWSRDVATERANPVSSNPAGWWVRNG